VWPARQEFRRKDEEGFIMLIGMMFALAIICILIVRPTFETTLTAVLFYGGIVVGMIAAFWYSRRLSGGIAGALMGGPGGKIKKVDAHASALVSERRYKDAVQLYREAIAKNKKDPSLRLNLADIYLKIRDYDSALKYIEQAVQMPKGMSEDERCSRINRLADLYLEHKDDRASAIRALQLIIKDYPESRSAVFARERIGQIRGHA
jgi:tetratricopeptide (TPR) repeat protein